MSPRAEPSLAETVLAGYLDQYHQRQAASSLALPFPSWEPNFVLAEVYAELAERAGNDSLYREGQHLALTSSRGKSKNEYVNALGFLRSLPASLRASDELPPGAVKEAFETGADAAVLTVPNGVFWRVRFMAAAQRLMPADQELQVELSWWQRRLAQAPDPQDGESFEMLARRALLQAELGANTRDQPVSDAARATVRLLAGQSRFPAKDMATVDLARAMIAASICGESATAEEWLDELLASRLDSGRRLLFSQSEGARYEQSPWVARALISASSTLDYLVGALARPLSVLRSKEVAR